MAVTKILARRGKVDTGIRYILNEDKTMERVLTAGQRCTAEHAADRMRKTKERYRQTGGVQYYHLIQSFQPGEVTPELALEIAKAFAAQHLAGYEAVMALVSGQGNCIIATQDGRIVDLDMEEALQMKKSFPMERYQILEALTLSGSHRR